MSATPCTCLRDREGLGPILVVDPACPALFLHVTKGDSGAL